MATASYAAPQLMRLPTESHKTLLAEILFGCGCNQLGPSVRAEFNEFLSSELRVLGDGLQAGFADKGLATIAEFSTLIAIMRMLEAHPLEALSDLRANIKPHVSNHSASILDQVLYISIRFLWMMNIQTALFRKPGSSSLDSTIWLDDQNLEEHLCHLLPARASGAMTAREGRLQPHFTMANMCKSCGLRLEWTSALEEHLLLDRRKLTLKVFPHKKCLQQMIKTRRPPISASAVPVSFLREVVLSLELLFPSWDEKTDTLLNSRGKNFHYGESISTASRPLNLNEFDYLQERLLEVYEEVYLSPPVSWAQLRSDRRNPQQWLTFWLALIIAVLTVISTIFTVLGTIAAIIQTIATLKMSNCS